jgi:hypothetical protein
MNEDGQCFPHYTKCPPTYWRADDDETGACVKIPKEPIHAPDDPFCAGDPKHIGCLGYYDVIAGPEPKTEPEPILGKCLNGATQVNGVCPKPTDDPNMNYCEAYGCLGSPSICYSHRRGENDRMVMIGLNYPKQLHITMKVD